MRTKIFRCVAGLAAAYHALLGLLGTFANGQTVRSVVDSVYGVTLDVTGQTVYLVKFTSAYFIAFAVAMALLAWKPVEHRNLVWVAVGLFGTRLIDRVIFYSGLQAEFQIGMTAEVFTVVMISAIMVTLVALRPKSSAQF